MKQSGMEFLRPGAEPNAGLGGLVPAFPGNAGATRTRIAVLVL